MPHHDHRFEGVGYLGHLKVSRVRACAREKKCIGVRTTRDA